MAERPHDPDLPAERDFAAANGWDTEYEVYTDFELPTYVGPTTFMNLPWITDPAILRARAVDVATAADLDAVRSFLLDRLGAS